ncbi:MAG: hypothetical protein AVO38_04390 [delta proteobacterium ML8_D]|jgi:hypothetical protein|nr:MAG: hypothetical protein AVO38_04390 [delta proteobacterium ML8_D]
MRKVTAMLTICLMCLLGTAACSKEEPPLHPPQKPQRIKIVKPVEVQELEKQEAPVPREQDKGEIPTEEAEEGKIAVAKDIPEMETGRYYIVKKGESLYDVACREEVYGNKLKWPILYRYNMDTLGGLKTEEDVVEKALTEGLKLRMIGHHDVEENLEKRQKMRWVVNVISISKHKEIVPITIKLIKDGHSAYLTQATIKGKAWTRLRVGFFSSRAEADAEKEKIKDLLHLGDPWSIELGEEEFEEFAGY